MTRRSNKTALFLAWRYLFSKKEHNIINVISGISMIGIMVSTAALVVVLSVFNGMSDIIGGWFNALHADYEITLREGKSFATDSFPIQQLRQIPGVKAVNEIVCDLSLANYDDRQELLYLKGVPDNYFQTNHFEGMLVDGDTALYKLRQPCAIMGTGSAGKLEVNLLSYNLMKMYYPKRTKKNFANAAEAFNTRYIIPNGVICTNTNYDENYIFCPISFVRELMDYEGEVTSLEIQLKEGANTAKVRKQIADLAGEKFLLKDQQEQEDSLYKTMKSEKFMIYLILAFILILAAFNIIGALGMLILEKKTDTAVLFSMGASKSLIQKVFIYEGIMVSALGGLAGTLLGALICFLQQTFHIVKLGGGGAHYIIPYYPVQIRFTDLLVVLFTILVISLLTSIIPAYNLKKSDLYRNTAL
ncbi:MAG: ABC transporter permease [Bacteroidales bacterium]|nr:ABC transporter permease [Bacteroidales bacterium]MBR6176173.1 ABC transporter permease [Bacteroidales bacterium]